MATTPEKQIKGLWKAQFDLPITYDFLEHKENKLKLIIQEQDPLEIDYKIDSTKTPMHLDIHHNNGYLGRGVEKCIFKIEKGGNLLVIASPLPTNDPQKFGPRPVDFNGMTTINFLRPGYEEKMRAEAAAEVAGESDEDQLVAFFKTSADLYEENVQEMNKIISSPPKGQSMEQILMVQHLQIATKLRNVEMKYTRVFDKVKECLTSRSGAKYGAAVDEQCKRFLVVLANAQQSQMKLQMMMQQGMSGGPNVGAATPAPSAPIIPDDMIKEKSPSSGSSSSTKPKVEKAPESPTIPVKSDSRALSALEMAALDAADTDRSGDVDEKEALKYVSAPASELEACAKKKTKKASKAKQSSGMVFFYIAGAVISLGVATAAYLYVSSKNEGSSKKHRK